MQSIKICLIENSALKGTHSGGTAPVRSQEQVGVNDQFEDAQLLLLLGKQTSKLATQNYQNFVHRTDVDRQTG